MGWSIGFDGKHDRFIGYGVPAYCDHPDCTEEIDRGLAYVCGGEPHGGEHGCGLFFCAKHLFYHTFGGDEVQPEEMRQACECCAAFDENDRATWREFDPKPDHPTWVRHMLRDSSWAQWRRENPAKVKAMRARAKTFPSAAKGAA